MSCCGNKRSASRHYAGSGALPTDGPFTPRVAPDVPFEYTGASGLTVTGTVTGRRYRFNGPGEIQAVDYRDAGGMASVPVLRKVTAPGG